MPITRHTQDGFSLIEVLIAVVVISVGFLATARMQIESLRGSQGAYFTSQANFMVREMTDRMRANPDGVINGHYNNIVTSAGAAGNTPSCINAETLCSNQEIAEADLAAWSKHLHADNQGASNFIPLLPSGDSIQAAGSINLDGATGVFTVSVSWSEVVRGTEEEQMMSVQVYP